MSLQPLWEQGAFLLQKCGVLCLPRRRCVRLKFKFIVTSRVKCLWLKH